jgi:hypothetical protein
MMFVARTQQTKAHGENRKHQKHAKRPISQHSIGKDNVNCGESKEMAVFCVMPSPVLALFRKWMMSGTFVARYNY